MTGPEGWTDSTQPTVPKVSFSADRLEHNDNLPSHVPNLAVITPASSQLPGDIDLDFDIDKVGYAYNKINILH